MTWDNEIPFFESKEKLNEYMLARLSESENSSSVVSESLGISPEDILIEYYRYGELTQQKKNEFWSNWKAITSEALKNKKDTIFINSMALAYELEVPENAQDVTDFIPKNADDNFWESSEHYELQKYTLKLIKEWQLIEENDSFWQSVFETYLLFLSLGDDTINESNSPPIISVYNGMGKLEERDFIYLIYYIKCNLNQYTKKIVFHICDDQQYRFFKDDKQKEMQILLKNAWDNVLIKSDISDQNSGIYQMQNYLEEEINKFFISIKLEGVQLPTFNRPNESPLPIKLAA